MRKYGTTLKYPTATTEESPNRLLRERCQFAVIHRPVCTIPGIETNFTQTIDIDVVRVATGGTYEDVGRRIGLDRSLELLERHFSTSSSKRQFTVLVVDELDYM